MSLSISDKLTLASQALGKSVVSINPRACEESKTKTAGYLTFGVKNTTDLSNSLLERLRASPDCLLLTVDHMSDLGRSVDTELVNPLTYQPMTGSTSGGAINVLRGINDFCIGTDGGGSVLAPALATNLWAFMGKGLGLIAGSGVSTDGLSFQTGIGFIGNSLEVVVRATSIASSDSTFGHMQAEVDLVDVVVPSAGSAVLPGGGDMHNALLPFLGGLDPNRFQVQEIDFWDIYNREACVEKLRRIWEANPSTCVLTLEGPIDVYGADETIPRSFAGAASSYVAGVHSKGQVKAVNIAGGSAFCVPIGELATGLVISCGPGRAPAEIALRLASELDRTVARERPLPEMFHRYFLDRCKVSRPFNLF